VDANFWFRVARGMRSVARSPSTPYGAFGPEVTSCAARTPDDAA
jgi:hypothetical protein